MVYNKYIQYARISIIKLVPDLGAINLFLPHLKIIREEKFGNENAASDLSMPKNRQTPKKSICFFDKPFTYVIIHTFVQNLLASTWALEC